MIFYIYKQREREVPSYECVNEAPQVHRATMVRWFFQAFPSVFHGILSVGPRTEEASIRVVPPGCTLVNDPPKYSSI